MYCVCGCLNGVYTLQGEELLNTGCLLCEVMTCFDMDWSDQKEFWLENSRRKSEAGLTHYMKTRVNTSF